MPQDVFYVNIGLSSVFILLVVPYLFGVHKGEMSALNLGLYFRLISVSFGGLTLPVSTTGVCLKNVGLILTGAYMHGFCVLAFIYTAVFGLRSSSLALCDGAWGAACMEEDTEVCKGEGQVESWMAVLYVVGLCGLMGTHTVAAGMCYHLYRGEWPMGVKVVDDQRLREAPSAPTPEPVMVPAVMPSKKEEPIQVVTLRDPDVQKILRPVAKKPSPRDLPVSEFISTREPPEVGNIINPNDKTVAARRNVDRWGF